MRFVKNERIIKCPILNSKEIHMQLAKSKLAFTLTLIALGTPSLSQETTENVWVAKDPYAGRKYDKEQVSTFAKVSNGIVTVTSGIGMTGYAGYQIYNGWETTSFLIPYIAQTIPSVPTLANAWNFTIATAALIGLGIPANMLLTYGAKKSAMMIEIVARYGLDAFKFGFNTLAYRVNHVRAVYLQGTLWQNNNVTYVPATANQTK